MLVERKENCKHFYNIKNKTTTDDIHYNNVHVYVSQPIQENSKAFQNIKIIILKFIFDWARSSNSYSKSTS